MIKHVKPTRLFICRGLVAFALGCLALSAGAAEIPFESPKNSIEYRASGNQYTWSPVTGETPKASYPYRPDLSKGSVSTVEPRAKWTPELPYEHKGGASAKMNFSAVASKAAVAGAAAKELAKGAVACGAKPGHPLVVSAQIAGCMGGSLLLGAAIDWGWQQLTVDESGDISVTVPGSDFDVSTGGLWASPLGGPHIYTSPLKACQSAWPHIKDIVPRVDASGNSASCVSASAGGSLGRTYSVPSSCPSGHYYDASGNCSSTPPGESRSLAEELDQRIVADPWGITSAKVMAGVMTAGHGVFTDGTSGTITGPNTVPLGTSSESWPVNVVSGTTTEAPVGYVGSTDPATKTATTTKEAQNTYSGNKQTVTQKGTTTTSITNNVTNNTSTSVTHNTQTDDAPKEPDSDFCEKHPDSLACAEADTPEAEIPEGQINISYEYADIFGNGACPADVYLTTHGQSLKVWDWQSTCSNVQTYFRPVLIACCAFIAFVIVSAGAKE